MLHNIRHYRVKLRLLANVLKKEVMKGKKVSKICSIRWSKMTVWSG